MKTEDTEVLGRELNKQDQEGGTEQMNALPWWRRMSISWAAARAPLSAPSTTASGRPTNV